MDLPEIGQPHPRCRIVMQELCLRSAEGVLSGGSLGTRSALSVFMTTLSNESEKKGVMA